LCSLPNLGDTRTIVTHPAQQRSKLSVEERLAVSITDGLVRVSGLETVKDVIADLEQALS
jgi:O-succinylhomoserine sulfhydrylase